MTEEKKTTVSEEKETSAERYEIPKEVIDNAVTEAPKRPPMRGGPKHGAATYSEKPKNFKKSFSRLMSYVRPEAVKLIFVMLLTALGSVLSALGPTISGQAINLIQHSIVPQGTEFLIDINLQQMMQLVLTGVIVYLLSAAFSFIASFLVAGIAQRIVYRMRQETKAKLDLVPLKYFDDRQYGDLLSRITNDMDTIQHTLQQNLVQVINAVFTLISVTTMMIINGGVLVAAVCLATLPLSVLLTLLIAKRAQKQFKKQAANLGTLNGHIEEMYSGYKIVKVFNMENITQAQFNQKNEALKTTTYRSQFLSGLAQPANKMVSWFNYILVTLIGMYQVLQDPVGKGIGTITTMTQYATRFSEPIQTTSQSVNVFQNAIAAAERVFEVLDAESETDVADDQTDLSGVRGEVKFENVNFSYTPSTKLIQDMNLSLNPGDSVAIVGPTGAGKTTLVNLLMRFYDIDSGKITIDGIDISQLNRKKLRNLYGMVLQDTWLFQGTVRDNIKFGDFTATDEQVVEAAKRAHAHDFITKLPQGYDTVLSEDASNLSNGQRQLITIARALLSNPKILILDEATSSVDTRTEQYIQTALTRMMKDRTSFVIAHRLSTIKKANLILVMNRGQVIEQGTHEELLAKNGFYSVLYNSQFNNNAI